MRRPKPSQVTFACLVALDGFHPLLFTQLTADLTLGCSDGSMFHPLSHTACKIYFNCARTAPNSYKQRFESSRVVVFDRLWANLVPILNRAFSRSNVHAKWWIHCLLISLRYQCMKLRFFHCFENYKSNVTKTTVIYELNVKLSWNFDTYRLKIGTS